MFHILKTMSRTNFNENRKIWTMDKLYKYDIFYRIEYRNF